MPYCNRDINCRPAGPCECGHEDTHYRTHPHPCILCACEKYRAALDAWQDLR